MGAIFPFPSLMSQFVEADMASEVVFEATNFFGTNSTGAFGSLTELGDCCCINDDVSFLVKVFVDIEFPALETDEEENIDVDDECFVIVEETPVIPDDKMSICGGGAHFGGT